jgi:hypothetical protein
MESEREYMRRRAGEEQAAADRASCDKARDRHRELAARYRDAAEARLALVEAEPELVHGLPMDFRILD